jgi:hypothetical protein
MPKWFTSMACVYTKLRTVITGNSSPKTLHVKIESDEAMDGNGKGFTRPYPYPTRHG